MAEKAFEASQPHPEEWERDLNPNFRAGQNIGMAGAHPEKTAPSAYSHKDIMQRIEELTGGIMTSDQLKQIPILEPGTRLEQGATYLDLKQRHPQPFTAKAPMVAGDNNWYVMKKSLEYPLWNRLAGVTDPDRLDDAPDSAAQ